MATFASDPTLEIELPDEDRRGWLLDGLARVVHRRGYEPLVHAPVLLPTDDYFPDVWESSPRGVRTLLRRLLAYAGLGDLRVRLLLYRGEHAEIFDAHGVGHGGQGAAAWFAGIEEGICTFGVEERQLRDVESLIGTLGHEVAHAYREHHGLCVTTRETEELLTDLTAAYLGFGVFLLNSSFTFKTGGYSETGERLLYERQARGYLSPGELAVLLGAQLAVRRTAKPEQSAIFAALSANQRKLARDAHALFCADVAALRERLGVPDPVVWGAPPVLAELTRPLDEEPDEDELISLAPGASGAQRPPRRAAVRVMQHRGSLFAVLGAVLPLLGLTTFVEGWALLGALGVGSLVGWVVGARRRSYDCSGCRKRQTVPLAECSECGAEFLGTARTEAERLAAEEAHEQLDAPPELEHQRDDEMAERELIGSLFVRWAAARGLYDEHQRDFTFEGQAFQVHYFESDPAPFFADYPALTSEELPDEEALYERFALLLDVQYANFIELPQPLLRTST